MTSQGSYLALNLTISSKVHVVFAHMEQYLARTKRGLSLDSEQSLEASHFDFAKTLAKYTTRDLQSSSCAPRPLRAVLDYNGSHL